MTTKNARRIHPLTEHKRLDSFHDFPSSFIRIVMRFFLSNIRANRLYKQ
jgi:hypothetical protein